VAVHSGISAALSPQEVSVLCDAGRRQVSKQAIAKLSPPPAQLSLLVVRRCGAFAGKYVMNITLDQVSEGMPLRLVLCEVTAFKYSSLCHLCPLAGVSQLGKGSGL